MTQLELIPSTPDLPTIWDGRTVAWQGWTQTGPVFICRPHRRPEPCTSCKTTDQPAVNIGVVAPLPGETFTVPKTVTARRSGRVYDVDQQVPAWPVIELIAFRCPGCQLDTVWDQRTQAWWVLDETDYGPTGSTDPRLF